MKTITFECETITPMFLAGADGQTPELRPPSIKGAMRFWWRAMNANYAKLENGKWDYLKLKAKEGDLFGNTENRSNVIIQTEELEGYSIEKFISKKKFKEVSTNSNIKYLAFGVYDKHFIIEGYKFKISLTFNEKFEDDVLDSFFCFSYFGGLGSKSRNGFGQFIIKEDLYRENVIDKIHNSLKTREYTAFTKLYFNNSIEDNNALIVWRKLAKIYKDAISDIEKTERNFIAKRNSDFQIEGTETFERIAKTFFISINKVEDKFEGMISYLPFVYPIDNAGYKKVISQFIDSVEHYFDEIN
jgi:CRISPR-associated protein Cmr1